jgi:hypothetical protein
MARIRASLFVARDDDERSELVDRCPGRANQRRLQQRLEQGEDSAHVRAKVFE